MTQALVRPVLYSFRRCPFAMRARLAIDIAGVQCELREVVLADKPAAMIAASPKGTVPVLIDPQAGVIDQSLAIMRHVLARSGCAPYLPHADPGHVTHGWVQTCDGEFKHHLDRYKYASRYRVGHKADHGAVHAPTVAQDPLSNSPQHDDQMRALVHRAQAADFVSLLDRHLRVHAHLAGARQGWADLAIAPFLRQFRLAGAQWFDTQDWPGVQAWLHAFTSDERFMRIMQKFPPWQEDAPIMLFP